MPWFALRSDAIEYETLSHGPLVAARPTLRVEIGGVGWLRPYTFFDTGAPVSVVSQPVAAGIGAALTPIPVPDPVPVSRGGHSLPPRPAAELLTWWDPVARAAVPCLLAELAVRLRDTRSGRTSDPLRLVAKVLQGPARAFDGLFVLLGNHLLLANAGRLHLDGQPWDLGGPGLFFPP